MIDQIGYKHAHSAFTKLLKNAEMGDGLPDHRNLLGWESGLRENDYRTSTVTVGRYNTGRLLLLTAKVKCASS